MIPTDFFTLKTKELSQARPAGFGMAVAFSFGEIFLQLVRL